MRLPLPAIWVVVIAVAFTTSSCTFCSSSACECEEDADCAGVEDLPQCDETLNLCVGGCGNHEECPDDQRCGDDGVCTTDQACRSTDDCGRTGAFEVCDVEERLCNAVVP